MRWQNYPTMSVRARSEQATFRALLDGMAMPGSIRRASAPEYPRRPWGGALSALEALLDHEVMLAVTPHNEELERWLLQRTGCRLTSPHQADYLLADGDGWRGAIEVAKLGTLEYPDTSATIAVALLAVGEGPLLLELQGPGIEGRALIRLDGAPAEAVRSLTEKNEHYPLGVDVILADAGGRIACLPRTTRISVHEPDER